MNCDQIRILLYEFITKSLEEADRIKVEQHLKECESCRLDKEKISLTLKLLSEVRIPSPSAQFEEKVLQKIQRIPKPLRPIPIRIKEKFHSPVLKWSIRGVAVAAMIILAITLYKGFIPEFMKPDRTPRDLVLPLKVADAKKPIVVETGDIQGAFSQLLENIQKHHGSLIRKRTIDTCMEVRLKIEEEREKPFFKDLNQLGKLELPKEGYKDGEGNIVILLKKSP